MSESGQRCTSERNVCQSGHETSRFFLCGFCSLFGVSESSFYVFTFQKNINEFYAIKDFIRRFIRLGADPLFGVLSADKTGILRHLPLFRDKYKTAEELGIGMKEFFFSQIKERRAKIDFSQDSEPTDYVEAYLRQQKKLEIADDEEQMYS